MTGPGWPSSRGWIAIGVFVLTVMVLWMIAAFPELRADEFFKALAVLIVGGFVKDVVGWAYGASKTGGELAQTNAEIVRKAAATEVKP